MTEKRKKKHIKPCPLPILTFQKNPMKKTHPAPLGLKMSGRWSPRWSWHSPRHGAWWAVQSCGKWCSSPPHNGSTFKHDILTFTSLKDSLWYKWLGCHPILNKVEKSLLKWWKSLGGQTCFWHVFKGLVYIYLLFCTIKIDHALQKTRPLLKSVSRGFSGRN